MATPGRQLVDSAVEATSTMRETRAKSALTVEILDQADALARRRRIRILGYMSNKSRAYAGFPCWHPAVRHGQEAVELNGNKLVEDRAKGAMKFV